MHACDNICPFLLREALFTFGGLKFGLFGCVFVGHQNKGVLSLLTGRCDIFGNTRVGGGAKCPVILRKFETSNFLGAVWTVFETYRATRLRAVVQ